MTLSKAGRGVLPAWVLDHLHTHGLPARRGQGTITTHRRTRATPRWHPCGQPVWTGLCDREQVTLDPTPTTIDGELFAILAGRRTYQLTQFHYEIERRHPAHITYASADQVRVYIAHACNGPHAIVNDKWEPKKEEADENPPF